MGDINNNEPERFLTATDALALFKRLQIEERVMKDEERHGSELPLEISEYLDSTPTYELKEEFTTLPHWKPERRQLKFKELIVICTVPVQIILYVKEPVDRVPSH
jgi:hypothetical protein